MSSLTGEVGMCTCAGEVTGELSADACVIALFLRSFLSFLLYTLMDSR